ncbi:hypothetical protein [Niallia sp. 01092]|uniref:hypothetical protein n=1 Tax=unclassified Niallia TaxID=2837522 RepID=UPI003FD0F752
MVKQRNRSSPYNYKKDNKARSDPKITILEDCDFEFYESELIEIAKWYTNYRDLEPIAKWLKRDPDEIILAVIHLAKERKINRKGAKKL